MRDSNRTSLNSSPPPIDSPVLSPGSSPPMDEQFENFDWDTPSLTSPPVPTASVPPPKKKQRPVEPKMAPFVLNISNAVNACDQCKDRTIAGWKEKGESFWIKDEHRFIQKISNIDDFSEFVLETKFHDFQVTFESELWNFKHPNFQQGRDDLLKHVQCVLTDKDRKEVVKENFKIVPMSGLQVTDMLSAKQPPNDLKDKHKAMSEELKRHEMRFTNRWIRAANNKEKNDIITDVLASFKNDNPNARIMKELANHKKLHCIEVDGRSRVRTDLTKFTAEERHAGPTVVSQRTGHGSRQDSAPLQYDSQQGAGYSTPTPQDGNTTNIANSRPPSESFGYFSQPVNADGSQGGHDDEGSEVDIFGLLKEPLYGLSERTTTASAVAAPPSNRDTDATNSSDNLRSGRTATAVAVLRDGESSTSSAPVQNTPRSPEDFLREMRLHGRRKICKPQQKQEKEEPNLDTIAFWQLTGTPTPNTFPNVRRSVLLEFIGDLLYENPDIDPEVAFEIFKRTYARRLPS